MARTTVGAPLLRGRLPEGWAVRIGSGSSGSRKAMLHVWDNFFIMTGTAGATLIGLLFVVITLATGLHPSVAEQGVRTFLTPTFAHFGGVLLQAMSMLVPWPASWPTGLILLLLGTAGLAYQIRTIRSMRGIRFVVLKPLDLIPHAGLPVLSSMSLIVGALGFIAARPFAPYAVAIASTCLLVAGIYGAWDLTLWIVRNRTKP
jgi:hypothetical protein